MMTTISVCVAFALRLMDFSPELCSRILLHYIHPGSQIATTLESGAFNEAAAGWVTVFYMGERGIENISLCEITRIEAPLAGFLVDATGYLEADSGVVFSVFRTGVFDGTENTEQRGDEFVFLAAGTDETGETVLFPTGTHEDDFIIEYEFLGDSASFTGLCERFPDTIVE